MTGRTVKEWFGKTPDARVPPRVRQRIWEREKGVCHLTGRKIRPGEPWDLDHKNALCNGGEHRESNLFPALRDKHREKTARDVAEKKIIRRKNRKHVSARAAKFRSMPCGKNSEWKKPFGSFNAVKRYAPTPR